jgi:RNA polymerase sigma factor (sigma-70 family)
MDAEARFRALFIESCAAIRRYGLHRGLDRADSDELVAEVFTIAWRRFDDVPDDAVPWLFGVARNVLRNMRRSQRRKARLLERLPRPEVALSQEADSGSDASRVRAALASLDESDRELLALIAWDGLTPQQAATVVGRTPGATRVRLHRARARLAAALETREADRETRETNDETRTVLPRAPGRGEIPDACT